VDVGSWLYMRLLAAMLLVGLVHGQGVAACVDDTPNPGCVHFLMRTSSAFNPYVTNPNTAHQEWFQTHFWELQESSPYFDSSLQWFPRTVTYIDSFGIHLNDPLVGEHPDWILKDQDGNWLYLNFGCNGTTCPQYAFDFSNPGFEQYQIGVMATMLSAGYRGLWLDDVDLDVETSNGQGETVYPVDANTGQVMTAANWEKYMANFTVQIRQAFPQAQIIHNTIWYAGSQPAGSDPLVQQEIQAADWINVERGVSDPNLVTGTGQFSLYSMLNFVDVVHSLGRNVSIQEYSFNGDYGLAGYYLISSGLDALGNDAITPENWWNGYDFDLGTPLAGRYYWQGVFRRDFSNGVVLLNPYGGAAVTLAPGGDFVGTDGLPLSSVQLSGGQAAVLIDAGSAPQVTGVVNSASYSSASFSPGEMITIFGQGIGPPSMAGLEVNFDGTLSGILGGATQVSFDGTAAPLIYVSSTQASAIVPYSVTGKQSSQLQLIYNGAASPSFPLSIVPAAPGLFAANQRGTGQGLILNQNGTPNSATSPAAPGSVVVLFGTGAGPLFQGGVAGQIVNTTSLFPLIAGPVSVAIANVSCQVLYAGSVPGGPQDLFQMNVVVPPGITSGNQPVQVSIAGAASQEDLTIAIQ
jgi:uncharacterized protein (TIGR03437 family)